MKIYLDNNLGVANVEQEELTQDTIGYNILKVYIPNAVLTPYNVFTCYYGALLQNGRKVGWFAMEARTSSDADYKANYTLYKATLEQCVVSVEGKVYIGCQVLLGNSGNTTLTKKNTAVVQFNVRKSVAINNDILVLDTDQTTTDVLESYKNLLENALVTYATKDTTYTKTEVNSALALKADKSNTYTKTEVDTLLVPKVSHDGNQLKDNNGNNIYPNLEENSIKEYFLEYKGVTPNRISFINLSKNLFNYNDETIIDNKYIERTSGNELDNSNYFISEYIEVYPNVNLICNKTIFSYALYDYNKSLLFAPPSRVDSGVVITTIPKTSFIRFSCEKANKTTLQLEFGNSITDYEEYKKPMFNLDDVGIEIDVKQTTFAKDYVNLYDYTKQTENKAWNSSLQLVTQNSYYAYGEVLELEPNSKYYLINCPQISNSFSFITDGTTQTTLGSSSYYDSTNRKITTQKSKLYLYLTFNKISDFLTPTNAFYKNNICISTYSKNHLDYGKKYIDIENKIGDINVFYVGANRSIKKLKDGIEQATQFLNSVVYVDDGTYDLVSEYGLDYLNSFTQDNYEIGLILKNNVKVIFSANSKVTFNYTGTNYYVNTLFSPFNFSYDGGGATLIGANIECSNSRYCIHDDQSNSKYTNFYHNQILKCTFSIDNSNNANWNYQELDIGGGLGYNGLIEIKECIFNEYSYYHQNAGNVNGKSNLYFCNNYSENTFRVTVNPNWTNITSVSYFYANNNSTTSEIQITDSGNLGNVKLFGFNNEVRS